MELNIGLPLPMVDETGKRYQSMAYLANVLHVDRKRISKCINRSGCFKHDGHTYIPAPTDISPDDIKKLTTPEVREDEAEYQEFRKAKEVSQLPFSKYDFKFEKNEEESTRIAVALFSDAHIEETVEPNSVAGMNEYNIDIAKKRIEKYFVNLVNCLNEDNVDHLIFASLGDTISGYIHDELAQNNGQTPLEATLTAQNLLYSGLDYICKNSNVQTIKFIGIVGNHSRTTKKIQHSNGFKLSYEWMMYKNIEKEAKLANLPIEFCLPESEVAIVDADGRKLMFAHGFQIKGSGTGTVCGIYPALNRLFMKWERVFHQDHVFIGHFHSCIFIPNATVNGSIIGYNAYALSNGMGFEEPAQCYVVYDSVIGELLTRKIYCK